MNRTTTLGALLVVLLLSTACSRDALPTCGSLAVITQVQSIIVDNAVANLAPERADAVRKSVTWSLDSVEKGELSSDGNVRKCGAQLTATDSDHKPLSEWGSRPIHYTVKALENSSKFSVEVSNESPNVLTSGGSTAVQTAGSEAHAINVLRKIMMGQEAFSSSCAKGFYAPTFPVLTTPPTTAEPIHVQISGEPEFALQDLVADDALGYHFELTKDDGDVVLSTKPTCNGFPSGTAVSSFKATAYPLNDGSGLRYFMTDVRGTILYARSKAGPWTPVGL